MGVKKCGSYFNLDDVYNNRAIPRTLTTTRPTPTNRVSPLKIFAKKLPRWFGIAVGVLSRRVEVGWAVLVAIGEGVGVGR